MNRKVEAFVCAASPQEKRFVNLNGIALGLLQVLALEMPQQVWVLFPLWFHTLPKHGFPSQQIVRLSLQHQLQRNLIRSKPGLLLAKLLTGKMGETTHPDGPPLAA